jgi:hypothetical protein
MNQPVKPERLLGLSKAELPKYWRSDDGNTETTCVDHVRCPGLVLMSEVAGQQKTVSYIPAMRSHLQQVSTITRNRTGGQVCGNV